MRPGLAGLGAQAGPAEAGQDRGGPLAALGGLLRIALVAGDHQAARARRHAAELARLGQADHRLGLVGQAQHGRERAVLGQAAQRRPAGGEGVEPPALVDPHGRGPAHPEPERGDHPEGALGAEDHLAQVGPGGGLGRAAEVEGAARGGHGHADDHVVEAAVPGRGLATGAGRGEAAQRGVLERLREVPQGELVGGQQFLGLRPAQTRLQLRDHRLGVHRDEPVEPGQVEGDDPGMPLTRRRQSADDRGAPAERDHRDPVRGADPQQLQHLVVRAGQQHGVGGVGAVPGAHAHQVGGGLAPGVADAGLVAGADVPGAEDGLQLREDGGGERRGGQPHLLQVHRRRLGRAHAQDVLEQFADRFGQVGGPGGIAPAGPEHRFGGGDRSRRGLRDRPVRRSGRGHCFRTMSFHPYTVTYGVHSSQYGQ
nr:hypothetical protein GCM10020093_040290 [Planobispora longispora]